MSVSLPKAIPSAKGALMPLFSRSPGGKTWRQVRTASVAAALPVSKRA
jgi:hypothetical protein